MLLCFVLLASPPTETPSGVLFCKKKSQKSPKSRKTSKNSLALRVKIRYNMPVNNKTNQTNMNTTKNYDPVALANAFHALYDAKVDLAHELHNMHGYNVDTELENLLDTLELTIRALKRKGCAALAK